MIATILPGSSNFHAVGYNERKVSKGVARLIEILRACLKTIVNRSEFSERNNNSCDHEHFVG